MLHDRAVRDGGALRRRAGVLHRGEADPRTARGRARRAGGRASGRPTRPPPFARRGRDVRCGSRAAPRRRPRRRSATTQGGARPARPGASREQVARAEVEQDAGGGHRGEVEREVAVGEQRARRPRRAAAPRTAAGSATRTAAAAARGAPRRPRRRCPAPASAERPGAQVAEVGAPDRPARRRRPSSVSKPSSVSVRAPIQSSGQHAARAGQREPARPHAAAAVAARSSATSEEPEQPERRARSAPGAVSPLRARAGVEQRALPHRAADRHQRRIGVARQPQRPARACGAASAARTWAVIPGTCSDGRGSPGAEDVVGAGSRIAGAEARPRTTGSPRRRPRPPRAPAAASRARASAR